MEEKEEYKKTGHNLPSTATTYEPTGRIIDMRYKKTEDGLKIQVRREVQTGYITQYNPYGGMSSVPQYALSNKWEDLKVVEMDAPDIFKLPSHVHVPCHQTLGMGPAPIGHTGNVVATNTDGSRKKEHTVQTEEKND